MFDTLTPVKTMATTRTSPLLRACTENKYWYVSELILSLSLPYIMAVFVDIYGRTFSISLPTIGGLQVLGLAYLASRGKTTKM
jgi:hypothetical protein